MVRINLQHTERQFQDIFFSLSCLLLWGFSSPSFETGSRQCYPQSTECFCHRQGRLKYPFGSLHRQRPQCTCPLSPLSPLLCTDQFSECWVYGKRSNKLKRKIGKKKWSTQKWPWRSTHNSFILPFLPPSLTSRFMTQTTYWGCQQLERRKKK